MKMSKKPWPLVTVFGIRDRIDTNPDFQRPPVWSRPQKQLLIDTALRGFDIPKLYWRQTSSKPDKYDVVDGQQRLRAIWEFFSGEYKLPRDSDPVDGSSVAGLGYQDLPDELRMAFETYGIDVIVLDDTDEDEVREMFLRLQNGTSLKAQEKRNAMPGRMRDFVKTLSTHRFFESVAFCELTLRARPRRSPDDRNRAEPESRNQDNRCGSHSPILARVVPASVRESGSRPLQAASRCRSAWCGIHSSPLADHPLQQVLQPWSG